MQRSCQWLFLSAAFALPPRTLNLDLSPEQRKLLNIPERRARNIDILTKTPLNHGRVKLADGVLYRLSDDALKVLNVQNGVEDTTRFRPAHFDLSPVRTDFKYPWGTFIVSGSDIVLRLREMADRNLWSLPLGFHPISTEETRGRAGILGWRSYPAKLFYFDFGEKSTGAASLLTLVNWSTDSEPVRFFSCQFGRFVLVENLPNGLTRFYFFERDAKNGLRPLGYTVFAFGPDRMPAEVSGVEHQGCGIFYVVGTFGAVRVRY